MGSKPMTSAATLLVKMMFISESMYRNPTGPDSMSVLAALERVTSRLKLLRLL